MTTTRTLTTNGVELFLHEDGPADGPVVVLSHGFPELGYSWRHQIPALAAAGYRVVAPDQRGYGRSSRPDAIEAYDIHHLTDDLLGVLDDIGAEQATFVGHDWGSMVVTHQALLHPDRVSGLVNMSVPFLPRGPMSPVALMRSVMGDSFFYILYFQEPGIADAELGADAATTMRRMLCGLRVGGDTTPDPSYFANDGRGFVERMPEPGGLPEWLGQAELDHYVEEFTRTGFTGGINWYRNFDRNWDTTPQLEGVACTVPSLFIGGAQDPVLMMSPPSVGHFALGDHRGDVLIDGAGHWVQQETPREVNDALIAFLDDVSGRAEVPRVAGYTELTYDEVDHVGVITLDRPEARNALTFTTYRELEDAVRTTTARCLVVTGTDPAFCSGDDVKQIMVGAGERVSSDLAATPRITPAADALLHTDVPVIAAVNGAAVGWGMELAVMADLRVASERARFGELFVQRGLNCDVAGLGRLAQLVGRERTAELLFTGRVIAAPEAASMGLVSRVVAHDQLLPTAMELATSIASKPPLAVQAMKRGLRQALDPDWAELGAFVSGSLAELFRTQDHREGVAAFLEKRPPTFTGT